MRFQLLGPVEVQARDGSAVALPGARARAILAMLLLARPHVVGVRRLFETGGSAKDPVNALHVQIAKLRAALPEPRLVSEAGGYRLITEPGEVDADVFAEACARGKRLAAAGQHAQAVETLRGGLALWRAPVAYDFAESWLARLDELRLGAVETAIDAQLALGHHEDLVAELSGLVAAHPLRERFAGQLMVALHRTGRQPEALAVFAGLRERLADELGADPSPELFDIHLEVLQAERVRPAGNVPHPVGELIGRAADVERVRRMLGAHRLVTLTGPGGVGKTRAARELGHLLRDGFRDGVWLVELASVARDGDVTDAIGSALQLSGNSPGQLLSFLREREVLLVLDNCEHVVDSAAREVSVLLGHCPRLTVLATSREPLHVEGERPVPLAPLPLDDAMRLFRDRTTVEDDKALAQLCARLDGLPLVLELAAAGTRLFSLEEIESRLDDLANASRHAPARHHSLRAVLDWSHDLLPDAERRVFAGLSVFSDGCTFADTEQVCGATVGSMARLVDKSLVHSAGGRFRMLETVRAYASSTMDVSEFRDRHADALLAFAREVYEELSAPRQDELLTRFLAELPNLRAVTTWLLRRGDGPRVLALQGLLGYFWYVSGREAEGAVWLERAIACYDDAPRPGCDGALAIALSWHSYLGRASGAHPDPWQPAQRVRDLYRTTDAPEDVRIALPAVAAVAVHLRPGDESRVCLEEAEKALAEFDHPWLRAILDAVWSEQHRREGDVEAAVAAARANLRYFEGIDDRFGVVYSQLRLGDAEEHAGRREQARERWTRARDTALAGRSPVKCGYANLRLAYLEPPETAIGLLLEVRADANELAADDLGTAAANLLGLAHLRHDPEGAARWFREAAANTRAQPIRTAVAAAHLASLQGPQWNDQVTRAVSRITDSLHLAGLRALLPDLPGLGTPPPATPLAALI